MRKYFSPLLPDSIQRSRTHFPPFLVMFVLSSLIFTAIVPVRPAAGEDAPAVVRKVVIEGNVLIETETIKSRLQTTENEVFDPEIISEDIRSIYNLGYFDDVRVKADGFEGGLAITFIVKEKPIIASIEFKGNKEVKYDKLRENTGLQTDKVVDEYEIRMSVERLLAFLHEKGFYQAKVDYILEEIAENEVSLIYLISEGESLWVTEIKVVGTRLIDEDDIKGVMKTKEKGLFSFFTHSGTLQARQLEEDVLRIIAFLYNNGHLKARVDDPRIEIDEIKKEIRIIINLVEGPRFMIGNLNVEGDELFSSREIQEAMKTRSGQVFKRDTLARDLSTITGLYTAVGYAFCRVDYRTDMDDIKQIVDLDFIIDRGPKVKVGRIKITGNQTTRDNVIRREITLREGEYFSSKSLVRSRQKIMNLGYFDKVDVTTAPRGEDILDINIDVTERMTGMLSLGVGYSSEDKFGGIFKITKDNLFGKGYNLQSSIEYSSTRQEYNIYFSNPSLWDSPYSLAFRVYDYTADYAQYDRASIGGSVTVGRSIGEYFRGYVTFKNENVEVMNIEENVSNIIRAQEGKNTTRSTTLKLVRDTRDNYFNPTRGTNLQFRGEYAGGFQGGDNYFSKYEAESTIYLPLFWKLVYSLHGEFGQVQGFSDREVPIYERFFLGGINTVRGFQARSIGPKDENDDPVGGHKKVFFNNEITFPISEEQRLMGVLFFDAGQAFGKDESIDLGTLRTSVGAGIRWFSPIGPFRIEWGYILDPEPGEQRSDWQFSIGTVF